ncbi:MAG: hypothetical protein QGI83_19235 [Candidatus Latescibacteria bacterium]|jgi:hypothetical protein|nr:hypothetical protein [Candidatus Latescibacterota bacterium]
MIERIEHRGKLIHECTLPGDTRAEGIAPAHPNGLQLSRDRFMLLVSTLRFLGVDDARSGVYEIRDGAYDGPKVNEGHIVKSVDDWDPLGDGSRHVRQHGHFTGFGVPKGALIDGKTPPHANVFAVMWRRCARMFDPNREYLVWYVDRKHPELHEASQGVEWLQLRLNDTGDDIEVIAPMGDMRQVGYEVGDRRCAVDATLMNNPYSSPIPANDDCTEWIDCKAFGKGGIAPCRYRYNAESGLYEWVETGPFIEEAIFEPTVARYQDSWIIAARPSTENPIAWMRCDDPFIKAPTVQFGPGSSNQNRTPMTVFTCPDGVLRLLTRDYDGTPHRTVKDTPLNRNPLYIWDVDPDDNFRLSNRRVVFDAIESGVPITVEHHPIVDMPKLLPHAGGRMQALVHRVCSAALMSNDPDYGGYRMTPDDFDATAVYYAEAQYDAEYPGVWKFE